MYALLGLSIALISGLLLSRLAKLLQLPAVTAYLVAGILIGPYCLGAIGVKGLGFISKTEIEKISLLADVALGFIAFSIGNEFRLSQLKKIGKQATIVGIFQAVVTTLLVDAVLIGLHFIIPEKLPLSAALVLGAIASATAPAATLMVVKQYKAKGPTTDILLPVVALDDAVGLILFAVSFGVAKTLVFLMLIIAYLPNFDYFTGVNVHFFTKFMFSQKTLITIADVLVYITVGMCVIRGIPVILESKHYINADK